MTDALYAFYDLSVSPISFDFSSFVVCAEVDRRRRGLATVHFVIVPAATGAGHWDNDLHADDHLTWRMHNIVVPLCEALPSGHGGLTICASRGEAQAIAVHLTPDRIFPERYAVDSPIERHHTGWSIIHAHQGEDLQCYRASEQARAYVRQWIAARANGRPCIALTLREAAFGTMRNSDPDKWGAFAQRLSAEGYFPVLLRDIDMALGPPHPAFEGIATFAEGAFNFDLRLALYEESLVSAFVANGPGQICFYSRNVRFLYFVTGDWLTDQPTPFARIGILFGETPPFANRYQRWIWKEQDTSLMMDEFHTLVADIAADKASGTYERGLDARPELRISIDELARRYETWAEQLYWSTPEELRLMHACRELASGRAATGPETLHAHATFAIGAGDYQKAYALLQAIGEKHGYSAELHVEIGVILEVLDRFADAVSHYESAIKIKSAPDLVYRLGVALRQSGNLPRARECLEVLVNHGIIHAQLFVELGYIYETVGEPERAEALYARATSAGIEESELRKRKSKLWAAP